MINWFIGKQIWNQDVIDVVDESLQLVLLHYGYDVYVGLSFVFDDSDCNLSVRTLIDVLKCLFHKIGSTIEWFKLDVELGKDMSIICIGGNKINKESAVNNIISHDWFQLNKSSSIRLNILLA